MDSQLDVACYYHEPIKVPLLREVLIPQANRCAERGIQAHVERHWLHGPHLRLRLTGPAERLPELAFETAEAMRAYVSARPSRAGIPLPDLLHLAKTAGREELIPPPYTPVHADNTVRVEPVDTSALSELLGSQGAVDCRMRLLRLGVPALGWAADWLTARDNSGSARIQLVLTAIATHAGRYPPGFGGGYQSFLSHMKEFLLHHDDEGRIEETFAAQWERIGGQITPLVARLAEAQPGNPMEEAWLAWSQASWPLTRGAHARGEIQRVPWFSYTDRARGMGDERIARRWNPDERTEFSDYHQLLQQTDLDRFPNIDDFVAYRFSTNILYLLLTILDVRPLERYLAAYLFSRAAETVLGVTWQERLARKIESQRVIP